MQTRSKIKGVNPSNGRTFEVADGYDFVINNQADFDDYNARYGVSSRMNVLINASFLTAHKPVGFYNLTVSGSCTINIDFSDYSFSGSTRAVYGVQVQKECNNLSVNLVDVMDFENVEYYVFSGSAVFRECSAGIQWSQVDASRSAYVRTAKVNCFYLNSKLEYCRSNHLYLNETAGDTVKSFCFAYYCNYADNCTVVLYNAPVSNTLTGYDHVGRVSNFLDGSTSHYVTLEPAVSSCTVYAFRECENVHTIALRPSNYSNKYDFFKCVSVSNVALNSFQAADNVTVVFRDCLAVDMVYYWNYATLPSFKVSYVNCVMVDTDTCVGAVSGSSAVAQSEVYNHQTDLYFTVSDDFAPEKLPQDGEENSGSVDTESANSIMTLSVGDGSESDDDDPDKFKPAPEGAFGVKLMTTVASETKWSLETLKEFLCSHIGVVFPVVPFWFACPEKGLTGGIVTGVFAINCEELAVSVIDFTANNRSKVTTIVPIVASDVTQDIVYKV